MNVEELRAKLELVEAERDEFKGRVEILEIMLAELNAELKLKDSEIQDLKCRVNADGCETDTAMPGNNYEALKHAVADLLIQNEEKSMKIDELRKAVTTYQRVEEIILHSQLGKSSRGATDTLDSRREETTHAGVPYRDEALRQNAPKIGLTTKRSNSYDPSKFNRIGSIDEGSVEHGNRSRKVSCTSLPKDYGYKVNMLTPDKPEFIDKPDTTEPDHVQKDLKKKKGIKRFFARIKRSTSQEIISSNSMPFRRGGVRSTAGARLGGSRFGGTKYRPVQSDSFICPFSQWSSQQVLIWLQDIGLSMYTNECHVWGKSGQYFLDCSQSEIEKQLKVSNALHKKKLKLAIDGMRPGKRKEHIILDGLNSECITKWLDDIGLPQYKHQFYEARVDGRVLNQMTIDDLLQMKINNALHHMSIKRGIEVLRAHNFNLGTLKRRPSAEGGSPNNNCSTLNGLTVKREREERDVSLWTNHRVMEWLRMIDLSEYAANLRGSGVHGALIMLEPRFTVDHLADILIMPTSKSLIRRHLSGHFVNLVGQQTQSKKREMENSAGTMLTLSLKVKMKKGNPFRRGRPTSEYLCPMENTSLPEPSKGEADEKVKSAVALYKKELSKQEAKRHSKVKSKSS